jgi:hypothetical protein
MHSLHWGFQETVKAELLLSPVQTPGARCACMQKAAILWQQHKQQKQKLPEEGREDSNTPKNRKFCKFLNF